eukprot:scaffold10841_cov20-Tisochrysis_lutea.AAC.6
MDSPLDVQATQDWLQKGEHRPFLGLCCSQQYRGHVATVQLQCCGHASVTGLVRFGVLQQRECTHLSSSRVNARI